MVSDCHEVSESESLHKSWQLGTVRSRLELQS
jgi:hypothetical protein